MYYYTIQFCHYPYLIRDPKSYPGAQLFLAKRKAIVPGLAVAKLGTTKTRLQLAEHETHMRNCSHMLFDHGNFQWMFVIIS